MALDEPRDSDNVYTREGLTFVMDTALLEDAQPVTVDYVENDMGSGYTISSNLPKSSGCGSCSC